DPGARAKADADPDDLEAQFAAADLDLAEQQLDVAFGRLINAVRRTAGDDRDRVRKRLVELFELFPADEPRVLKARRDLASALF
ncbi:MAG TPA: tetratricopeptide repeat protein, partial [Pseudonocardiaceae bacterium]|nr:tetratricopeptide repeat protein [Pseudonocardiaceae bacterium]